LDTLESLLAQHLAEPFPDAAVKGLDYGKVDAVMIGADVYGWSSRVERGEVLSDLERRSFEDAATDLSESILLFPDAARPYYELLLRIARAALNRSW